MRLLIAEVLEKVKTTESVDEKIKILKQNISLPLKQILYANFSDKVTFLIPETPAPFKPSICPIGLADTNLFRETQRLYLFVKGGHPTLKQTRREELWVQLLEGVAKEEAALLESLKNKKLASDYNLSVDVAVAAFPDLQLSAPATTIVQEQVVAKQNVPPVAVAAVNDTSDVSKTPVVSDAAKPKRKRGRPKKGNVDPLPIL